MCNTEEITAYYKSCYPEWDILKVEQEGKNRLILIKREIIRGDGIKSDYELKYLWLCEPYKLSSVLGSESTYWTKDELDLSKSLFDQVNLF